MKPQYTRAWTGEEIISRDQNEAVKQSDKLTDAISPLLFGKHPGVQMLSLAELACIWIMNHPKELQNDMMEAFFNSVRGFVDHTRKEKHENTDSTS